LPVRRTDQFDSIAAAIFIAGLMVAIGKLLFNSIHPGNFNAHIFLEKHPRCISRGMLVSSFLHLIF